MSDNIRQALASKLGFFVNDSDDDNGKIVFVRFAGGKMSEHNTRPAMQTEVKLWQLLFSSETLIDYWMGETSG